MTPTRRSNAPTTAHLFTLCVLTIVSGLLWAACSSPGVTIGDPCQTSSDCDPQRALVCDSGFCFRVSCDATIDCPDGTSCIDDRCRAPECSDDDVCPDDSLCLGSECVEGGCRSRDACEAGQVCRGEPSTCRAPPDVCASDSDCPVGTSCWPPSGECRTNCSQQSECSSGQYCGDRGQCRPNCTRDTDCLSDETCAGGRCEPLPDCSGMAACTGQLRFRDPLTCDCVECLQDDHCDVAAGEACTDANQCLFCQLPAADVDCGARGLIERQGCCVECQTDADCGSDLPFCAKGRCASTPPEECVSDSDCTGGKICDRGTCAPAASFAPCDAQVDCVEGEACFSDGRCHAEADSCGGCEPGSRCVEGATGSICAGCSDNCSTQPCRDGRVCVVPSGSEDGVCIDDALATQCSG